MAQQARNICMRMQDEPIKPRIILHDRDTKYSEKYRRLLKSEGIKPFRLPAQSPNLNAYAERWVKTIKQECLDHFVVVGGKYLNHLLHEYVDYYNTQRHHQGLGNEIPMNRGRPPDDQRRGKIRCEQRLGGLLKHYYRTAA